jgi:cell division transport system permease protein
MAPGASCSAMAGCTSMIKRTMVEPSSKTSSEQLRITPRRDVPLVPPDAIASRALVTVIAIMTFLASLTAGAAIMINGVSRDWRQDVSREMTIQVKPSPGRNIEQDVRKAEELARATPGVAGVRSFSKSESEKLLEPWLGAGLELGELPVPRLIVLRLSLDARLDIARLRSDLGQSAPSAILDDHKLWIERLATMSHTMVVVAVVVFFLVLIAMALAVAFATRGAMAGSREVINVLHFVGARDSYIARQFQRHFLLLGLKGGVIGGCAAIGAFFLAGVLSSRWVADAGGEQIDALFGTFSLGMSGYAATILIAGFVAVLTGLTSRSVVFRHLQGLE